MNIIRNGPHPMRRLADLYLAGAVVSLSAVSAMAATSSDIQLRYERERARCLSGQSGQSQATCLKEAGASRDAAVRGQLADGDGKLRTNAKERCDVMAGDEKSDCMARVKGSSNTTESGSVKGGGILRETVTIEPASAASAASR